MKEWKKPSMKCVLLEEADMITCSCEDTDAQSDFKGKGFEKSSNGINWDNN